LAARQILALVVGVRVPAPQPLIRRLVAIALILEAVLVVTAAWLTLTWLFAPAVFLAALGFSAAAPFAAWVSWHGRWSDHPERTVLQMLASGVVAVGQAVLAVIAGFGVASAIGAADRCEDFRIDPAGWRTADDEERERLARTIARCDALEGTTRAEVTRLLGQPEYGGSRRQRWYAGNWHDAIGPGDAAYLAVRFGSDGRVTSVTLPD
jgi:hypothetical protein